MNTRALIIFNILIAESAFSMHPCPEGTSPWYFNSIGVFCIYLVFSFSGVYLLLRKAYKSPDLKIRRFFYLTGILGFLLAAMGALVVLMYFSWVGDCR